jgi:hypothetical protein
MNLWVHTIGRQHKQKVFINVLAQAGQAGGQAYGGASYGVQQYGQTGNVRCFVQDGGRRHIFFLLIIYMLYYYLSMYKCCTRVDIKIPTKMLKLG